MFLNLVETAGLISVLHPLGFYQRQKFIPQTFVSWKLSVKMGYDGTENCIVRSFIIYIIHHILEQSDQQASDCWGWWIVWGPWRVHAVVGSRRWKKVITWKTNIWMAEYYLTGTLKKRMGIGRINLVQHRVM